LWKCHWCRVVVYCRTGQRSSAALIELEAAGFNGKLYNGLGVTQWVSAGYSLVSTPSIEDKRCMTVDQWGGSSALSRQGGGSVCAEGVQSLVEDDEEDATPAINQHQLELDTARSLFLSQMELHNSTEYSFLFSIRYFGPLSGFQWLVTAMLQSPVQGSVGDTVLSAIDTKNDVDMLLQEPGYTPWSILRLFDEIQEAIDNNASRILVDYHPKWGYPQEIYLDHHGRSTNEWWFGVVTNFTLVNSLEYHIGQHPELDNNHNYTDSSNETLLAEEMIKEFTEQLAVWDAFNLYEYYFTYIWIPPGGVTDYPDNPPWTALVQNGTVVTATNAHRDEILTEQTGANRTINDIFAVVQAAMVEGAPDSAKIIYDSEYGFPTFVLINYNLEQPGEELIISVSAFTMVDGLDK
jgi:Family of unknown function (DUF6174)